MKALQMQIWRLCALGLLVVVMVLSGVAGGSTKPAPAKAATASDRYVTFMLSRGQVRGITGPSCTPMPNGVTIWQVAADLAARGYPATAAVSPVNVRQSSETCADGTLGVSWDELATLQGTYGWDAVPRGNASDIGLPTDQQLADSCNLLPTFYAHGFPNAWSMYAYWGGDYTTQMQTDVVSKCFGFGRAYRIQTNVLPVQSPYMARVFSINGGNCADPSLPCSTLSTPYPYTQPSELIALMQAGSWAVIQGYKFVTGAASTSAISYDCTGADPRSHWSTKSEVYCYNDWLSVVDAVPASAAVVSPDVVAAAQGRVLNGALARIAIAPAQPTVVAGGHQAFTAEGFDDQGHDLGSVTADTAFSIDGGGSCTGSSCGADDPGSYVVSGADGDLTATATLTVVARPTASDVAPALGVVGDVVTLTGSGLDLVTGVSFNGTATTFSVVDPQHLTATVPNGASTGPITLSVPGDQLDGPGFVVGPRIDSFSPATAAVGAAVTINGSAFVGATGVSFGGVGAGFTVNGYNRITATVPAGVLPGPIRVTAPGGTATSAASFGVKPAFTSFTPAKGTVGTVVTIKGSGFAGTSAVTFNDAAATFTIAAGGGSITTTVPAAASTGKIGVTVSGATVKTFNNFSVVPTITGFTPASGPAGTVVTITGTGFVNATQVTFGSASAAFTVDSPTQLRATVPSGIGSSKITVRTAGGAATTATKFTVRR